MQRPLRLFSLLLLMAQLSGCIAPAPSNTDWRSTPKVVLQVCIPGPLADKAEIVYYRPQSLGPWTATPIATTETGQSLFESTYENWLGSAFGVNVIRKDQLESPKYYIFLTHETATTDWSPWKDPDEIEASFPKEIWKYKKSRRLMPTALNGAPKIRYRTEFLNNYGSSKRSRERYTNIPSC